MGLDFHDNGPATVQTNVLKRAVLEDKPDGPRRRGAVGQGGAPSLDRDLDAVDPEADSAGPIYENISVVIVYAIAGLGRRASPLPAQGFYDR